MRRIFTILIMICLIFTLSGCNADNLEPTTYDTVNNFDGVSMTAKEGTVTNTKMTLVLENKTNAQCIYGDFFMLEKNINGSWYQVPITFKGDYGFVAIGYILDPGENGEWSIDWEWLYGKLDNGKYRIIKEILEQHATGGIKAEYYLAAEFIIN